MKRKIVFILCFALIIALFSGHAPSKADAAGEFLLLNPVRDGTLRASAWNTVYFGSYPASEITQADGDIWYKLEDSAPVSGVSHQVAEYVVDGIKYRSIHRSDATCYWPKGSIGYNGQRTYTWDDGGYELRAHYFRYEPIRWRVLSVDGDNALLFAENILDCRQMGTGAKSTTWEESKMRSWLNGYSADYNANDVDFTASNFIDCAFSLEEQSFIADSRLVNEENQFFEVSGGNDTTDKVFLPSMYDFFGATGEKYGFGYYKNQNDYALTGAVTTYAWAMGATKGRIYNQQSGWWMRTTGKAKGNYACVCADDHIVNFGGFFENYNEIGVRPCININWRAAMDAGLLTKGDDIAYYMDFAGTPDLTVSGTVVPNPATPAVTVQPSPDVPEITASPAVQPQETAKATQTPVKSDDTALTTKSPTVSPSIKPGTTGMPTVSPSVNPGITGTPTVSPSVKPEITGAPTVSPSVKPEEMEAPTISPSVGPGETEVPSVSPKESEQPTGIPDNLQDMTGSSGTASATLQPAPSVSVSPDGQSEWDEKEDIRNVLLVASVKAKVNASNKVVVSWKQNEIASAYEIYRSTVRGKGYRLLKTVSGAVLKYTDKNVVSNRKYYYKVGGIWENQGIIYYGKFSVAKGAKTRLLGRPVIRLKKGRINRDIRYIAVFLRKYQGEYVDIYVKKAAHPYRKINLVSHSIKKYRGIFKLRCVGKKTKYYLKVKTYRRKSGKRYYSSFSKQVPIRI